MFRVQQGGAPVLSTNVINFTNTVVVDNDGVADITASFPDGTIALPSIGFASDPTTGLCRATDLLGFSVNGVAVAKLKPTGLELADSTLAFTGSKSLILLDDAHTAPTNHAHLLDFGTTGTSGGDGWKIRLWGTGDLGANSYGFGILSGTLWYAADAGGRHRWYRGTTEVASLESTGQFRVPTTGSGAGLLIGGDTHLYRDSANVLKLASGDSFLPADATGQALGGSSNRWDGYFQTLDAAGSVTVDQLRVGTATDTATSGDFVAGLTGAARLFYDQSAEQLNVYGSTGAAVARIIGDGNSFSIGRIALNDTAFISDYSAAGNRQVVFGANAYLIGGGFYLQETGEPGAAIQTLGTGTWIFKTFTSGAGSRPQIEVAKLDTSNGLVTTALGLGPAASTMTADVSLSRASANTLQLASGDSFIPADATGQELGGSSNRWDVYARNVYPGTVTTGTYIASFGGHSGFFNTAQAFVQYGSLGNGVDLKYWRDIHDGSGNRYWQTLNDANTIATSYLLLVRSTGQFRILVDGSSAGLKIGSDTHLYRTAANTLALGTGDDFVPADATGQNLGGATNRWEAFLNDLDIAGNTTGSLIPSVTATDDLGSATKQFRDVFINGDLNIDQAKIASATASTTQTLSDTDSVIQLVDTTTGALTTNLPAAPSAERFFIIKNIGANTLTIGRNGKNIDGVAADLTLAQNEFRHLYYDGTGWQILGK